MLKSAAMAYALVICVILGLFLGMLIMLQSNERLLQQKQQLAIELVNTNASATAFYLSNNKIHDSEASSPKDILDNGMFSLAKLKYWGYYKIGIVRSFFKNDTITKAMVIGEKNNMIRPALYLTDYDKPLNMVGKATIDGDVAIPRSGMRRGNIFNNEPRSSYMLRGERTTSTRKLPEIKETIYFEEVSDIKPLESLLPEKKIERAFTEETLMLTYEKKIVSNFHLKGNIILKSNDTLIIKNNNVLTDIMIQAPTVIFETNFSGTLQVFASQGIFLENKVTLKYPSSLFISRDSGTLTEINIGEESTVIGGVVLTGDQYRFSLQRLLTIAPNAKVVGDVYCFGKTQLEGSVTGSLYTDRFYLKTASAIYENYIYNGTINSTMLPEYFIRIPLLDNGDENRMTYEIIKEL